MFSSHLVKHDIQSQLLKLARKSGLTSTVLDGVHLLRVDKNTKPEIILHEPSIVFIGQGLKRVLIGNQTFDVDAGQCMIVSISMPVNCDTFISEEGPLLALIVHLEMAMLSELILKMGNITPIKNDTDSLGLCVITPDSKIEDIILRLLSTLASDEEAKILGNQILRELAYRAVLQGPARQSVQKLITWHGRFKPIYEACERIKLEYSQNIDISALAKEANMSVSSFHKAFKAVTSHSPIQYMKMIRLHRARELILSNYGVSQAAYAVGYESSSQFSREFKRLFGCTPTDSISIEHQTENSQ